MNNKDLTSAGREEAAAYHEAAHAVVAFALGIGIRKRGTLITPDEESSGRFWHSCGIGGDPHAKTTADRMRLRA